MAPLIDENKLQVDNKRTTKIEIKKIENEDHKL